MRIIKYKQLDENENYEEFEKEDKENFHNDKNGMKYIINGIMSITHKIFI